MSRRRDATRLGGTRAPTTNPHLAAREELSARHPRLARLCELTQPLERSIADKRPLSHLVVRTIVSQLVSTAAARSIMRTLLDAHRDVDGLIPWAMRAPADAPPAVFKGIRKPAMRKLIQGHESLVALCCWALLDKGRLASFDSEHRPRSERASSGPRG